MKKILFIVILIVVCTALMSEVTYYGSARVGFWYDMTDEDHANGERTNFDQSLQEDSHFGIDFTHGNLAAKAELGFDASNNRVNVDLLWARRYFNGWSLVIGKDDFGSNMLANQAFRSGLGLDGYGALNLAGVPQVRFEVDFERDLFYFALMSPAERSFLIPFRNNRYVTPYQPIVSEDQVDLFLPRIMIGYNVFHENIRLKPMAMFQAWRFDKEHFAYESYDDFKTAWLIAITNELVFNRLDMKLHVHYGQNIGNLGFNGEFNRMTGAIYPRTGTTLSTINTAHITTLGGYFTAGYDLCEKFNLSAGVGYTTNESASGWNIDNSVIFHNNNDRLAFYLQGAYRVNNFSLVPELGMFMERKNQFGHEQGNQMYFGTQLRYDF